MNSGICRGDLVEFKVIISDGGTTYQKEIKGEEAARLVGLRIGEVFSGGLIGESGTLQITGGTDRDGFPMRKGIPGPRRIKILVRGGTGFCPKRDGERRKKRVHGDTISETIVQINTKMVKKEKPEKEEVKEEVKEKEIEKEKKPRAKPKVEAEKKVEEVKEEGGRPIALTKVSGIGKKTVEQLNAAGITSVQEFVVADAVKLAKKTGLSVEKIEKLKAEAQELMG